MNKPKETKEISRRTLLIMGIIAFALMAIDTKLLLDKEILEWNSEIWSMIQWAILLLEWLIAPIAMILMAATSIKTETKKIGRLILFAMILMVLFVLVSLPIVDYPLVEALSEPKENGTYVAKLGQTLIENYSFSGVNATKRGYEAVISDKMNNTVSLEPGESVIVNNSVIALNSLRYPAAIFRIKGNFTIRNTTKEDILKSDLAKIPKITLKNIEDDLSILMLDTKGVSLSNIRIRIDSAPDGQIEQVWLNGAMLNDSSNYTINPNKDFLDLKIYPSEKEFPSSFIQVATIKSTTKNLSINKIGFIVNSTEINTTKPQNTRPNMGSIFGEHN